MRLPIAHCRWPVQKRKAFGKISQIANRKSQIADAFTLIEIMVVVAIIGLVMAMGVPSLLQALQKQGMRKAVSDVQEILSTARAQAILQGRTKAVVFFPHEKKLELADVASSEENGVTESNQVSMAGAHMLTATTLPDNVEIAMLDINLMDFGDSDWGRVRFFPNGTCDEMTLVLHANDDWEKITLEFSTGIATVSQVKK